MTWALLGSAGGGLLLGIVLLIWALNERGGKHRAVLALENARSLLKDQRAATERLRKELDLSKRTRRAAETQITVLRNTITGLHEKLAKLDDPEAIKDLLNEELGEQI
jgi:hypothetical protein